MRLNDRDAIGVRFHQSHHAAVLTAYLRRYLAPLACRQWVVTQLRHSRQRTAGTGGRELEARILFGLGRTTGRPMRCDKWSFLALGNWLRRAQAKKPRRSGAESLGEVWGVQACHRLRYQRSPEGAGKPQLSNGERPDWFHGAPTEKLRRSEARSSRANSVGGSVRRIRPTETALAGWAGRIRTSESVRALSDWNSVTTSPE
jgi:hypothetical protein